MILKLSSLYTLITFNTFAIIFKFCKTGIIFETPHRSKTEELLGTRYL